MGQPPTSRLEQNWEAPHINSNVDSQLGKGLTREVWPLPPTPHRHPGRDFKLRLWGLLLIIPDRKLISSSVCKQKCSSCFSLTFTRLFVFLLSENIFLGPEEDGGGVAYTPRDLSDSKPTALLSKVLVDLLVTTGLFASPVVQGDQARSAGGQGLVPLLLKPKQDYLYFSFPNSIHGRSVLTR